MKPESRLDIAKRLVAETEALVEKQAQLVNYLEESGYSAESAIILLSLMRESLKQCQKSLSLMEKYEFKPH
jgi:hypothetical protein